MSRERLAEGRFLRLLRTDGWEYCSRVNARAVVTLVALDPAGRLLLTEQYRAPLDQRVIELPAGLVGDEDDPEEALEKAGLRELEEETGFRADWLAPLTDGPTSAGMTDELIHFLLAGELTRTGPGGGTGSEDIQVHAVPLAEVPAFLDARRAEGRTVDPKVYVGLYFLGQKGPALRTGPGRD